jgi:hypothetical protein
LARLKNAATPPAMAGLCVAAVAMCLLPLFAPGEPAGADLSLHLAEIAGIVRALRAHDLGLWNESANLGYPSGYYYPILPQLVPALAELAIPSVSLLTWFKIAILIPLALLPATTYRALVVAGTPRWGAAGAAAAVVVVSGGSEWGLGIDSMFTKGLYAQAWGMLFFPLAFAYGARWLLDGKHLARAVVYALLVGLCHPMFGFALLPGLAATPWWTRGLRVVARRSAALAGFALVGSAFFWAPILVHYDSFGGFPARLPDENGLAGSIFSVAFISGALLDFGRLPLLTGFAIAAVVLAVRGHMLLRAVLAPSAAWGALVVLGAATGPVTDDLIPAIRFLAPMQLGLAAAAGIAAVEVFLFAHARLPEAPGVVRFAMAGVASSALVVLAADTWRASAFRVRTIGDFPAMHGGELNEMLHELAKLPRGRVVTVSQGTRNHWFDALPYVYSGQPALRAYGGAPLQSSANYIYLMDFPICAHGRLYGARWILADRSQEKMCSDARVVHRTEHYSLLELPNVHLFEPIAVTGSVRESRNLRRYDAFEWLRSQAPQRSEYLAVGSESEPARQPQGRVVEESSGQPYAAAVSVDGPSPTTFALKVTWHPGWHATIDGADAPVRRVTPDFLAVDVPPGEHRVRFTFRRPAWTWALLFGDLGFVALLVAWARLARDDDAHAAAAALDPRALERCVTS